MTEEISKLEIRNSRFGVYVHIPFCRHKCPYCDFVSGTVDQRTRKEHLSVLGLEIRQSPWRGAAVHTLFFGGGTPSDLAFDELSRLVDVLRASFDMSRTAEWTLEANPGTLDERKLEQLRDLGFNRLSLGVQSLSDRFLEALGRIHSARQALEAFAAARAAGFDNINLDSMFGIPGQSLADWTQDLQSILDLRPEHVSLYNLTIEPDTEFFRQVQDGRLVPSDEGLAAEMFEQAMDLAEAAGYVQYEISNYALPGRECLHNQVYWTNQPYLGFGLGASSYANGTRWKNVSSYEEYAAAVARSELPMAEREHLNDRQALGESVMLALRTARGVDLEELGKRYQIDAGDTYSQIVRSLTADGLLIGNDSRLCLSRKGRLLADYVCMQFLA